MASGMIRKHSIVGENGFLSGGGSVAITFPNRVLVVGIYNASSVFEFVAYSDVVGVLHSMNGVTASISGNTLTLTNTTSYGFRLFITKV